jgi:hypothetical protein
MSDNAPSPTTEEQQINPVFAQLMQQYGSMEIEEGFGPNFPYPVRYPTGVAPALQGLVKLDFQRGGGATQRRVTYSGPFLVNEKGVIVRGPYDPDAEARKELFAYGNDVERAALLNLLHTRGFYGSGKPSVTALSGERFESKDLRAMADLLYFANSRGSTWQPLMAEIAALPTVTPTGPRIRTSSKEDIRQYVNRDSLELLGRTLTRAEFREALQMIQARERAPRAGETQASLGALSAQAVKQIAPREVQIQSAADAIDVFRQMLRASRG